MKNKQEILKTIETFKFDINNYVEVGPLKRLVHKCIAEHEAKMQNNMKKEDIERISSEKSKIY